jgi:hypothetical protein
MHTLVSRAQSAFINTMIIHDNFMYVRNYARRLHKSRTLALLLKLDIKMTFDSVRWDYPLYLLQRHGFTTRFRNWLVALYLPYPQRFLSMGFRRLRSSTGGAYDKVTRYQRSYLILLLILCKALLSGLPPIVTSIVYTDVQPSFLLPLCRRRGDLLVSCQRRSPSFISHSSWVWWSDRTCYQCPKKYGGVH